MRTKEQKSAYDQAYAKEHIKRKLLSFNVDKPDDQLLLAWLESQDNMTDYIKQLIRDDMNRNKD